MLPMKILAHAQCTHMRVCVFSTCFFTERMLFLLAL